MPAQSFAAINGTVSGTSNTMYTAGIYHYGPSIIMNGDGTGDAWFCGPGTGGAWDFVYHEATSDNGVTWTGDSAVLKPTAGSPDAYSNCDPGAIKIGGYYYIGYTSTANSRGANNQVYVARSTSATGPWDKWNGSGWGGTPAPFITYSDSTFGNYEYGSGEPSFVYNPNGDGLLHIYYTYMGVVSGSYVDQTRHFTADPSNANWPGSLTYKGVALEKTAYDGADSADVKYVDAYSKFLAVTTARRFGPSAYLQFWESTDGNTFVPADINVNAALPFLHNAGLSGDSSGHINASSNYNFVAYAYGPVWAYWNTSANPVTYGNNQTPAPPRMSSAIPGNGAVTVTFTTQPNATSYQLFYDTTSHASDCSYSSSVMGLTSGSYNLTGLTNGTRYFFATKTVNTNGTSSCSEEIYTTPLNYTSLSISTSTAASTLSGFPASNSYDANNGSFYSSQKHNPSSPSTYCCNVFPTDGSTVNEWIYWDLGSTQSIARMTFTPRALGLAAPELGTRHVTILGSNDATSWFKIDYAENVAGNLFTLTTPVAARYIKLAVDRLKEDEQLDFYLQIAEVKFESNGYNATASSYISGWEPYHVFSADLTGASGTYSSNGHTSANSPEWVQLDMGVSKTVTGLNVTPRSGGLCFPVNFTIQSSADGSTWTNILGQSYTSYPNPGSALQSFRFSSAVTTRYLRINATALSADSYGNYYLQIAHLDPVTAPLYTLSASSVVATGWEAAKAGDGNLGSVWSSSGHSTANNAEWIQLDFGATIAVSTMRLFPRPGYCFPAALQIDYSTDGVNWTRAPGQTFASFPDPATATTTDNVPVNPLFVFKGGIQARYVKVTGTTLRADNFGTYYFQLADIVINPDLNAHQ